MAAAAPASSRNKLIGMAYVDDAKAMTLMQLNLGSKDLNARFILT